MNKGVLNKYKIEFITSEDGVKPRIKTLVSTDINSFFFNYFISVGFWFLKDELLLELDKAINGLPFDTDGGGYVVFLTIDKEQSQFRSQGNLNSYSMPTTDLRDLISNWVEYIEEHNLDKNIL